MSENRCEAELVTHPGPNGDWRCGKPAKYFENGKYWCGLHAPSKILERKSSPGMIKNKINLCKSRIKTEQKKLARWEKKLKELNERRKKK